MRILRICYEYPPPWDGLTPGPFEISVAQVKQGHEIYYICGGNEKKVFSKGIHLISVGKSAPIYLFGPYFSVAIKVIPVISKIVKRHNIDVIHIHGSMAFWFNILRLIGLYKKIPYVYHTHSSGVKYFLDLWPRIDYFYKIKGLFVWPLFCIQDLLTVKAANRIICVSSRDKSIFKKYYHCPDNKIIVVENGVNTKLFSNNRKCEILTQQNRVIKLLYVGKINKRKNIERMIRFAAELNKIRKVTLTIVGTGEIPYIKSLNILSNNIGFSSKINWIGYRDYPNLPSIYRDHDALLLFSLSEGLPKVVLEALSCGLRVFSSFSFNADNEVTNLINLFDLSESDNVLVDKFLKSIDTPFDNTTFRSKYAWDQKVVEIENVYKNIIINI